MGSLLYVIISTIAVIYVLLWPKGWLMRVLAINALGVTEPWYKQFKYFIPVYNSYSVRKMLYGESKVYKAFTYFSAATLVLFIAVRFVFPEIGLDNQLGQLIQVIFTMWVIAWIVFIYLFEVHINVDLCMLIGLKSLIVLALVPPVCSALLAPKVAPYFKKYRARLDGTFDVNTD